MIPYFLASGVFAVPFSLKADTEALNNSEVVNLVVYIKRFAPKLDAERRRDATGRGTLEVEAGF